MSRKVLMLIGIKLILLSLFIKSESKLRMIYSNGHDALLVARCEAKCWKVENTGCVKGCLSKPTKKPGTCPQNITTLSPFARVCLHSCQLDSQCSGLEKCCQHSCGITCQEPENLLSAVGLPDIPKEIKITERRKRTIYVEWSVETSQATTVFLIEEHHHTGKHFTESKLSRWLPIFRTNKTYCVLKRTTKPGNWYQFRVAAVNENGTMGYSESSLPFSVSVSPKPPRAPLNVTVGPLFKTKNGNINVELRWAEPLSDLAIQRYKVFWSIRLHGIKALDSVLVRHQVVPKDQTTFLLQNLTSNSLYFLQVQAISQYGNQRLKSEKSNLALNTSNYINANGYDFPEESITVKPRIEDLKLQKMFWSKTDLKARITWRSRDGISKYTVSWWQSGHCDLKRYNDSNHSKLSDITNVVQGVQFTKILAGISVISKEGCGSSIPGLLFCETRAVGCRFWTNLNLYGLNFLLSSGPLSGYSRVSQFDLYNIKFSCRYRVTVREISPDGRKSQQDTSITFETPSCKKFRSSHKKIKCVE